MFVLRDYQGNACDAGMQYFLSKSKKRPLIIAPTGAGKSLYIAHLAKELQDGGVLVLQPSVELLIQNYNKFIEYGGEGTLCSASTGKKEISHTTFATIGSVVRTPELFKHVKYVLIDECHTVTPQKDTMYGKFFAALPHVKILGVTATAFRLKSYEDFHTGEPYSQLNILLNESPKFFNEILFVTQIRELVDRDYFAPVQYVALPFDKNALRNNSTGAEFSDRSLARAEMENNIEEKLPDIVRNGHEKGRKHCLAFVRSVAQAKRFAAEVPNSAYVDAKLKKKERAEILSAFKSGEIKTVFNVNVLTIGFDFPELDFVLMGRATMSLAVYMQIIGRGVRPAPEKDKCTFVDMCGNIDRFGELEDLEYRQIGKKWNLFNGDKQLTGVRMGQ